MLALQSAGAGGLAVSALLLAATLPLVVLAPLTGRLADRVDSRGLLVAAGLAQAATSVALALTTDQVALVALVGLLSVGLAVTQPTLSALIPAMVRREDLPRAGAVSQTAGTVGMLVGPALAGLLVGQFGATVPLLVNAVSYLLLVGAGLALRTRRGGAGGATPAPEGASSATSAWSLWRDPLLLTMIGSIAAVVGAIGAINVVQVFFVRETLRASETTYGLLQATWMIGMLIGAWLCARLARRARDDAALVGGILLLLGALCLTLPVAAVASAVGWLFPLWIVGGSFNGGMNVFTGVVMANRVPAEVRGRAFATLGATVQGAGMFGYFAGGILVDYLPIRPLVAGLGVAGLAVVAALTPSVVCNSRRERSAAAAGSATITAPGHTPSGQAGYGGDHVRADQPAPLG